MIPGDWNSANTAGAVASIKCTVKQNDRRQRAGIDQGGQRACLLRDDLGE
jgi:hypothetical protein